MKVQYVEVAENPNLLRTFDSKTKSIISETTLVTKIMWYCGMESAKIMSGNLFSPFSSVNDI